MPTSRTRQPLHDRQPPRDSQPRGERPTPRNRQSPRDHRSPRDRQPRGERPILIVGAGIAGLSTALRLADAGRRPTVIAKTALTDTASYQAQGGIAAVMGPEDSLYEHRQDTLRAGDGLCRADIVRRVVRGGPECIRWLQEQGVRFTRNPGGAQLHLTREGGHSRRRIVHADDATGRAVMGVLADRVRQHPGIELLENRFAADLLTVRRPGLAGAERCGGLTLVDTARGRVETCRAGAVVLATGGAAGVYRHATNASTGDGIAMAWRAGCRISNMEFVQFHPSCLHVPGSRAILITEALRGEGAHLRLPDGDRFMARHDARLELAPRDVVSRAIVHEMAAAGCDHVLLDISHRPAAEIRRRFPNILATCRTFGFDLTAEPIPVTPAAHYTCGGVVTDADGRTDIENLYAVGEVGCTGLHGANRLASNSLLEALAFARSVSARIDERARRGGECAKVREECSVRPALAEHAQRRPEYPSRPENSEHVERSFRRALAEYAERRPQPPESSSRPEIPEHVGRSFRPEHREHPQRSFRPEHSECRQSSPRRPQRRAPAMVGRYAFDERDRGWPRECAAELRRTMWRDVGIVRTRASLARASGALAELQRRIEAARHPHRLHPDLVELANLVTVARLITASAVRRRESRGLHYNRDYPRTAVRPPAAATGASR